MEPDVMKKCGFGKTCKKLCSGEGGAGGVCPQLVPSTCEQCQSLGDKCIKNNGQADTCQALGYKKGKCAANPVCPQIVPTTCEQCQSLGPKCIENNNQVDNRQALGYKKGKCVEVCPLVVPNNCQ